MGVHDSTRAPAGSGLPLAALQQGMLYQALLAPAGGFDVEQLAVHLREPVDPALLREAWMIVGARFDALRLSFAWSGLPQPEQRFAPAVEPALEVHDWQDLAIDAADAQVRALVERDRRTPFDLGRPPWRVTLGLLPSGRTFMLWTIHHLCIDGRSFARVLNDVMEAHAALRAGRAPALGKVGRSLEEVVRARSARAPDDADLQRWRTLLAGRLAPTPLPFTEPISSPLPVNGTGIASATIDAGTTAGLHALAVACGAKMADVVHGLWALFLARWSGERDVVIGSTRSTRRAPPREDAPAVVGMFINTVPVRAALDDGRTVRHLLADLRGQVRDVRGHRTTPLVDIARALGVPGGVPLFETLVMFDVASLHDQLCRANEAWRDRQVELFEQPAVPLVLTAFDGPRLTLRLLYQRSRLKDEVAARALRHLDCMARRLARGPDQRLGDLDALPDDERDTVVHAWNATARPFPDRALIHQGFEAQADRQPDAPAVVQGASTLSYGELERRANRLAHLLRQRGVAPGTFVGLCLDRTPHLLVALLGVAKAGAAWVPLDPDYPAERIALMLEDSAAELVITEAALLTHAGERPRLVLDGVDAEALASMPASRPQPVSAATDVCYAIYTSGSTGRPKGVVLSHRAVVNTFDWVSRTFEVGPRDRLLFVTSPCFDLSVYDTFGVLAAGGAVEVASSAELKDPAALADKLVRGGVTIWDSAPQALVRLLPHLPRRAVGSRLRLVLLSGDWIPLSLPQRLHELVPGVGVTSLGGATEAAIWSNWFPVEGIDARWRSVPYGKPIQNARYHVLDHRLRPVPPGVPGELFIGGACLAEGYLHRPELTAERFIADPFRTTESDGRPARLYRTGDLARYHDDGTLELLGRADFQVKVRGFRVELGEIEAALRQQPAVDDAVCKAKKDSAGESAVWAYVTLRPGAAIDRASAPTALRRALAECLPDFMVPAGVLVLDALPISANGKVDRAALPDPATVGNDRPVAVPRTALEARLLSIWCELLQRGAIGVDDSFFDLGGHSLLAVHLIARLKRDLGVELPLASLLQHPTIAKLAARIDGQRGADASSRGGGRLLALHDDSTRAPLFLVSGIGGHVFTFRTLADALGTDQPVLAFAAVGADGEEAPKESVEEIAEAYQREIEARGTQGPLFLGGYSFGALVAFELAQRLRRRGGDVRGIVAFDAFAPGFPERLPPLERMLAHTRELARRDARERLAYLADRANNLRTRALFRLGLGHRLAPAIGGDEALDRRLRTIWAASMNAHGAYRPRDTHPGPLLLFVAGEPYRWPATRIPDATLGWRRFVDGRIDVVTLRGQHLQLFAPDNVARIASHLRRFLDELGATRAGSAGS